MDGPAFWDFAQGEISAGHEAVAAAWMPAAPFGHTGNARPNGLVAAKVAERPIAPGKVPCPKPPWDTAFPGAFFVPVRALFL